MASSYRINGIVVQWSTDADYIIGIVVVTRSDVGLVLNTGRCNSRPCRQPPSYNTEAPVEYRQK